MIQPVPTLASTIKNLEQITLRILRAGILTSEQKGRNPGVGTAALNGTDAHATALAHAALPDRPPTIEIEDWDDLFRAVESRLTLTVGPRLAGTPEPLAGDRAGRIQVIVLECVSALDQLHTALTHERARCQQLEREVSDAQAGLAMALANSSGGRSERSALS
jgi:hypothetical protein